MSAPTGLRASRRVYRAMRDLHLYLGLFLSPFVLAYAASAIVLAHAWSPAAGGSSAETRIRRVVVAVPDEENSLELAKRIREQVDVSGEIGWIDRRPEESSLSFPVDQPGRSMRVTVDLSTGVAEVEQRSTGAWAGLVMLHKKPGPHNVALRGNWGVMRVWGWLADATVYLLLFLSASGVYLWTLLRAERRRGLVLLGAGALSFILLVLSVTV